jgi:chromosome segregation ATPase
MEFGTWQGVAAFVGVGCLLWLLFDALDELKTISRRLMSLDEQLVRIEARLEEVAELSQTAASDLTDLKSEVAGVLREVEQLNWQPPPRI